MSQSIPWAPRKGSHFCHFFRICFNVVPSTHAMPTDPQQARKKILKKSTDLSFDRAPYLLYAAGPHFGTLYAPWLAGSNFLGYLHHTAPSTECGFVTFPSLLDRELLPLHPAVNLVQFSADLTLPSAVFLPMNHLGPKSKLTSSSCSLSVA